MPSVGFKREGFVTIIILRHVSNVNIEKMNILNQIKVNVVFVIVRDWKHNVVR